MTDLRQAAQQALEAWDDPMKDLKDLCVAMDAIRTALEQQQAEPPSEWPLIKNILDEYGLQAISFVAEWKAAQQQAEPVSELQKRYLESEKAFQQQAEPVAWMDREGDLYKMPEIPEWAPPHTMLYTTPPQRQWVGLTDEDMKDPKTHILDFIYGARWAEAKLKEKNSD